MRIHKHVPSETPLSQTRIHKKFKKWLDDLEEEMETAKGDINGATEAYQRFLIKENRKKDFLKTFIVLCDLAFQNIDAEKEKINQIRDVIGYVIGDIIFETTDIIKLNKIMKYLEKTYLFSIDMRFEEELNKSNLISEKLEKKFKAKGYPLSKNANIMKKRDDKWVITDEKKFLVAKEGEKLNIYEESEEFIQWINDRKNGKVWVLDTSIDSTIEEAISQGKETVKVIPEKNWGMTFEENAKYDLALFSGVSVSKVEAMLASGISHTYLHSILYGSIMLRILMDALKDDLYLTWLGDEDLFIGSSGVSHFFDGIITLEEDDRENPWLLKCIPTYCSPLDAIESVDAKLIDIGVKKCILFVPMYPSQSALRYTVYTYSQRKHEILMLYKHDLYNMIEMEKNEVKKYLMEKRIR
jgi:hypothetical protein